MKKIYIISILTIILLASCSEESKPYEGDMNISTSSYKQGNIKTH